MIYQINRDKWNNMLCEFAEMCHRNHFHNDYMKRNKELKNLHKGRRCFIIGNGSSILNQDLSLLKDEIVFVTNSFWRNQKNYESARPTYYLLFDPMYFSLEHKRLVQSDLDGMDEMIKSKECDFKPSLILPVVREGEQDIAKLYRWYDVTPVYHINNKLTFYDGYGKKYDLSKSVPAFQCVIQYAMAIASYMGVRYIYLLGVEQTNILDHIEAYLGKESTHYAFSCQSEKEKKEMRNQLTAFPLEKILKGYSMIFHLYKEVFQYLRKQGIEVYNCTPISLIDSIPFKEYESLF